MSAPLAGETAPPTTGPHTLLPHRPIGGANGQMARRCGRRRCACRRVLGSRGPAATDPLDREWHDRRGQPRSEWNAHRDRRSGRHRGPGQGDPAKPSLDRPSALAERADPCDDDREGGRHHRHLQRARRDLDGRRGAGRSRMRSSRSLGRSADRRSRGVEPRSQRLPLNVAENRARRRVGVRFAIGAGGKCLTSSPRGIMLRHDAGAGE